MSSLLNSQGMVLATAMAVSGTVILYALCRHKPFSATQFAVDQNSAASTHSRRLRSCISSHEKKREKKKKRVHFAEDVVEQVRGEGVLVSDEDEAAIEFEGVGASEATTRGVGRMPANRMALYSGILQDRLQRMACY